MDEPLSPEASIARVEQIYQRKLEAGEVIQMMHRGPVRDAQGQFVGFDWKLSYVDNNTRSIERKLRQGFVHCEMEEEIVKRPVPKPVLDTPKAAPKATKAKE